MVTFGDGAGAFDADTVAVRSMGLANGWKAYSSSSLQILSPSRERKPEETSSSDLGRELSRSCSSMTTSLSSMSGC